VHQVGCVYYVITSLWCTVNKTSNSNNTLGDIRFVGFHSYAEKMGPSPCFWCNDSNWLNTSNYTKNIFHETKNQAPPAVGLTRHLSFHLPYFPILNFANAFTKCGVNVGWKQAVKNVQVESYGSICSFIRPITRGRKKPHANYTPHFILHSLTNNVSPPRFWVK
jgi:hypothetical protein